MDPHRYNRLFYISERDNSVLFFQLYVFRWLFNVTLLCRFSSEVFGILVQVDFDIAAFRSPAYQRSGLLRPSMEVSS